MWNFCRRACPIAQPGNTIASCNAGGGALLLDLEGRYDHGVMRLGAVTVDGTAGGHGWKNFSAFCFIFSTVSLTFLFFLLIVY